MKKQTVSLLVLLLAASGFFFSCGNTVNKNAYALEFDSIQVNETVHLFGDTAKPACNYRNDLEPMYKKDEEDKQDEQSIGAWYSYYKGIESHVQLCNTLILTYRIDYNEYTGGAHGIYMSTFLNLDLKTLSPIHLGDLFEGDYKEALTDLLWKQLMADNNVSTRQELEDMGYATTGDLEPIENFYLDPTGITFYYNVYEIAPYVMGATKITLSYEDITHLMNSEFVTLSNTIKAGDQ